MTPLVDLLIIFALLLSVSYFTAYFWRRIFRGRKYSVIVFPGVVIHELSHLIGCIITFAKVKKVKLFSMTGGYVRHKKSKIPIVGEPIISFFPVVGGTLSLFLIYRLVGLNLPAFEFNQYFFHELKDLFVNNWNNYIFWIAIYLSISIIISIIPSKKDFKNSFFGLLVIFTILTLILEFFSLEVSSFLSHAQNAMVFSLSAGFIVLVFSGLLFGIKKIILSAFC